MQLEVKPGDVADGIYWTGIFVAPKTGNKLFIPCAELLSVYKNHAKIFARDFEGKLKPFFRIEFSGQIMKVEMPRDKSKYPCIEIVEQDMVLPVALISGPLYDKEVIQFLKEK